MATKLVKIQERGQITLPIEMRKRWNLKPGDLVAVEETSSGLEIVPRATVAKWALDQLNEMFKDSGITLEEIIESTREERLSILEELRINSVERKDHLSLR